MSNILDGKFYDNINNPSKRIAIINTDFTENDQNWERMEKDVENIKRLLYNLGFDDKNIKEIRNQPIHVIAKHTSNFCTLEDEEYPHSGYIMMFNLTYKYSCDSFRAGKTFFNSNEVRNLFLAKYLKEWATKPKLIFYQTPYIQLKSPTARTDGANLNKIFALPIVANIFESFSNYGDEDSYGDEKGSFYIQALCNTINHHIEDQSIGDICINKIMYKVHLKVEEMVGNGHLQTPHIKSTLEKKFVFP